MQSSFRDIGRYRTFDRDRPSFRSKSRDRYGGQSPLLRRNAQGQESRIFVVSPKNARRFRVAAGPRLSAIAFHHVTWWRHLPITDRSVPLPAEFFWTLIGARGGSRR